jgi:hypothetical protein
MQIKPGEEIHGNGGQRLRVLAVVPFEEEDESPFVGLLQVEAAVTEGVTPDSTHEGERVAYLIVKTPFMPNEAWESTVHLYGYRPLRRKVTRRVADWPCESFLVLRPLMLK